MSLCGKAQMSTFAVWIRKSMHTRHMHAKSCTHARMLNCDCCGAADNRGPWRPRGAPAFLQAHCGAAAHAGPKWHLAAEPTHHPYWRESTTYGACYVLWPNQRHSDPVLICDIWYRDLRFWTVLTWITSPPICASCQQASRQTQILFTCLCVHSSCPLQVAAGALLTLALLWMQHRLSSSSWCWCLPSFNYRVWAMNDLNLHAMHERKCKNAPASCRSARDMALASPQRRSSRRLQTPSGECHLPVGYGAWTSHEASSYQGFFLMGLSVCLKGNWGCRNVSCTEKFQSWV